VKKFALLLCLLAGCRHDRGPSVAENGEDRVMLLALGTDDERAVEFAARLVERYARDSPQDKLVIARLGHEQFLTWEGHPTELKKLCPGRDQLKSLLSRKEPSPPAKLLESLRDALKYTLSDPRVGGGKARPLVFVLSPMADDGTDFQDQANLNFFISEVGWRRGEMRLYFVEPSLVPKWRDCLEHMRVQKSAVFSEAQGQPPVPSL
jgi:hypothetical protein